MSKDLHIPIAKTAAGCQPSMVALEEAACRIEPPVNTGSTPHSPHPPTKSVTSDGDRRVSTVLLDSAAPDPILMGEAGAGSAVEVSFHAASHTHLGVRLLCRDAQLRTENGNF